MLERLITCVNNFLQRATTPILNAYGFNCDYIDSDGSQFADVIDHMTDNDGIITCGYEIKASKITRTLSKAGKIINLESVLDGNQLRFANNCLVSVDSKVAGTAIERRNTINRSADSVV